MQWSQLKKRINERLAESVHGRIDLRSTSYRHSLGQDGRGSIAIDGHEILSLATMVFLFELWRDEVEENELHSRNIFARWAQHADLQLASYL